MGTRAPRDSSLSRARGYSNQVARGYTASRKAGGLAIGQCPPLWELGVFVALLFNDSVTRIGQGPSLRRAAYAAGR